jgi:hypothetical protein
LRQLICDAFCADARCRIAALEALYWSLQLIPRRIPIAAFLNKALRSK